jgi:hypothetical protein
MTDLYVSIHGCNALCIERQEEWELDGWTIDGVYECTCGGPTLVFETRSKGLGLIEIFIAFLPSRPRDALIVSLFAAVRGLRLATSGDQSNRPISEVFN